VTLAGLLLVPPENHHSKMGESETQIPFGNDKQEKQEQQQRQEQILRFAQDDNV
jgi:hypothetical protein